MKRKAIPDSVKVRKAPVNEVFAQHPQGVRGTCCWCGGTVTETTPVKGWLKYWHDECQAEYLVCSQPDQARDAVRDRDQGICVDCCAPPITERREWKGKTLQWGYETETWHVDHKVPLWKVSHLPPLQRIDYFKLANLVTRCEKCHKEKTKDEAAERAHLNRLASPIPKKRKGKKMKSRGFQPKSEGYKHRWGKPA